MYEVLFKSMEAVLSISTFEDLECWRLGRDIRRSISAIVKDLPDHEKFTLSSQLSRASRSITNNIAEGYGRFHYQENVQFCRISRGSAYEIIDHLLVAYDEQYINEKKLVESRKLIDHFLKVLNGYINYLVKAKSNN